MIELRDYKESDVDRLVSLANNKQVSKYLVDTFPYPYTRKDAEFWITKGSTESGTITKVIVHNETFVGSIGMAPQRGWKSHTAEIGYWLGIDYWGKGIAAQAVQTMTDFAFTQLNFIKLFAPVLSPNIASMRVLEKSGYELEGILKKDVEKDGQYYDIHHYAKSS